MEREGKQSELGDGSRGKELSAFLKVWLAQGRVWRWRNQSDLLSLSIPVFSAFV